MHSMRPTNAPTLGLLFTLTVFLCLITRDAARAANVSWNGANSGVWSNANNWSGGVVPNNGTENYFVSIANAVGQYTYVTQDLPSVTVSQLTLGTLTQVNVPTGNTLRLANPAADVRAVNGGVLGVAGTIRIATDGATLSLEQTSLEGGSILGNGVIDLTDYRGNIYGSGVIGNSGTNGTHDLRYLNIGNFTLPVWTTATSHANPLLIGPSASATIANPGIRNEYGILAADNGTLILRGPSIVSNAVGGEITARGTGIVKLINGIDIQGISTVTPGFKGTGKVQIPVGESATVRRSSSAVAHFESLGSLTLGEGFVNEAGSLFSFGGTISRLPGGSTYAFANKGTLRGLNDSAAVLDLGNWTFGNANGATIEGAGIIKTAQLSTFGGLIRSNIFGQALTLLSSSNIGPIANLLATNHSTLMIGTVTPTPNYVGGINASSVTIDAGSAIVFNTPSMFSSGTITNNGTLTFNSAVSSLNSITGTGTVRFSNIGTRSVPALRQGKLDLNNVTLSDPTGSGVWRTSDLSFGGTATLALRDSPYILDHGAASPIGTIQTWMAEGRFTSLLNGEVVGYVEAADIGSPTTFMGEPNIDPTTLLFRSTFAGDTNLDHIVDFADLLALAQNYGSSSGYWNDGDFDHDRLVGFSDLLLLAQHYSPGALEVPHAPELQAGAFAADWTLARSLIPEPVAAVSLISLPLVRRRRIL